MIFFNKTILLQCKCVVKEKKERKEEGRKEERRERKEGRTGGGEREGGRGVQVEERRIN